MQCSLSIFRRGFAFRFREQDPFSSDLVYFCLTFARRGRVVREYRLSTPDYCGALQFTVYKNGKRQGWRLQGPIQHFESSV